MGLGSHHTLHQSLQWISVTRIKSKLFNPYLLRAPFPPSRLSPSHSKPSSQTKPLVVSCIHLRFPILHLGLYRLVHLDHILSHPSPSPMGPHQTKPSRPKSKPCMLHWWLLLDKDWAVMVLVEKEKHWVPGSPVKRVNVAQPCNSPHLDQSQGLGSLSGNTHPPQPNFLVCSYFPPYLIWPKSTPWTVFKLKIIPKRKLITLRMCKKGQEEAAEELWPVPRGSGQHDASALLIYWPKSSKSGTHRSSLLKAVTS